MRMTAELEAQLAESNVTVMTTSTTLFWVNLVGIFVCRELCCSVICTLLNIQAQFVRDPSCSSHFPCVVWIDTPTKKKKLMVMQWALSKIQPLLLFSSYLHLVCVGTMLPSAAMSPAFFANTIISGNMSCYTVHYSSICAARPPAARQMQADAVRPGTFAYCWVLHHVYRPLRPGRNGLSGQFFTMPTDQTEMVPCLPGQIR